MIYWTMRCNPIVGCTKCSPACDHCYAERLHTQRHKALLAGKRMPECYSEPFDHVRFLPERLAQLQVGGEPQRFFACNMSDMFHSGVREEWQRAIFQAFAARPRHTFCVLTKRWRQMRDFITTHKPDYVHAAWPLPNVWLGATIWDQASADRAVPVLLDTPAAKRFVSVEPMLGPVDLGPGLDSSWRRCRTCGAEALALMDSPECDCADPNYAEPGEPVADWVSLHALDWVICGGETGAKARPMHPDWPRSLRDQCQDAGVPFFFKQWGEWAPGEEDGKHDHIIITTSGADWDKLPMEELSREMIRAKSMLRVGHRRAGRVLDGQTWEEVPA
jgi:protein gp37